MKKVKRLYSQFQPEHYELYLEPDRESASFYGQVTITGRKVGRPSKRLTLHQKGLKIKSAEVFFHDKKKGQIAVSLQRINNHLKFDEVRLHAAELLFPGQYEIKLEFSGKITEQMHGIYPCSFAHQDKKKQLIATQFESHHAREAFPCIDEPEAKATFGLSLLTPKGETAIANTPIKKQVSKNSKVLTAFERTPPMSTYLLAFVYGEIHYKEARTKKGLPIRVYATPLNRGVFDFALDAAVRSIEFFEDYFGVEYPLAKLDMAALPDFSAAAMENWGLVTYRESYLLVDPKKTSVETMQSVALVVAHELAHQWFGNLVTMKWWDDLWLNESFANLMEYIAVDQLYPDWNIWEMFVNREQNAAQRRDSLLNVQPVKCDVRHPDEISTLFDPSIVYAKGGNLLNMMRHMIGEPAFRQGLAGYFKKHQYANTVADDLWEALSKTSNQDVGSFMNFWLSTPGFPTVSVSYTPGEREFQAQQKRLVIGRKPVADETVWPIPLAASLKINPETLDKKVGNFQVDGTGPLILNHDGHSYFIPHYTNGGHLKTIAELIVNSKLDAIDRLLLLQNYSLLERAGLAKITDSLDLLDAYRLERQESVWSSIAGTLGGALLLVDEDRPAELKMFKYMNTLLASLVAELGWDGKKNEPVQTKRLRDLALTLSARAETKDVIAEGLRRFRMFSVPADLAPDIRGSVYYVGAKYGTAADFNKLLTLHNSTENAEDRDEIVSALCTTRNQKQIRTLLDLIISDKVRLQDVSTWFVFLIRNRYAKQETWQWLKDNWPWVEKKFGDDKSFDKFPRYAASAFSREKELAEYKTFFEPKKKDIALERTIQLGIEEVDSRVQWRANNEPALHRWLKSLKLN